MRRYIGLLVLLACLALAGAARRWFLGNEAIGRREDEQELARLNAALKRSLRMGDEIRLARRYRMSLDYLYLGDESALPKRLADAIRDLSRNYSSK